MTIIFWQIFVRKFSFKIICTFSHFSYTVVLLLLIIILNLKERGFLLSLCILVFLSLLSQPPTYITLLLRWHYSTHQTCNFNRGWQGDLDDRCSYGNRWHWQTREAAVCRLHATCAWSDWVHQLSRLPVPRTASRMDWPRRVAVCMTIGKGLVRRQSGERLPFLHSSTFLTSTPHHHSLIYLVTSVSQRCYTGFIHYKSPLKITSYEGGLHENKPTVLLF